MEPSLKDGDILLIRRSDNILWQYWKNYNNTNTTTITTTTTAAAAAAGNESAERMVQRQTLEEFEARHCATNPSLLLQKPPMALTGDVVVYIDPSDYYHSFWRRPKVNVKRVVGLGGQIVMIPSRRLEKQKAASSNQMEEDDDNNMTGMRIATTFVAPYSLWLEGDNSANSIDSRDPQHGAISKNLLVGIAEYVLWPPTRIGKVEDIPAPEPRPQSYWA
eukprot:scaffold1136_cov146-Cylindrotheca_fusiformis.AAC.12